MKRLSNRRLIVAGGENDHVTAPGHRCPSRELPLGQVVCVIGEVVAAEIEVGDLRVVDFDPVGGVAVVINQAVVVGGQELGDHWSIKRLRKKQALLQGLQPGSGSGRGGYR